MWRQSPAMFGVTARSVPWPFHPPRHIHPRHAVILHPSFIFSTHQNGIVITPIITLQTETRMAFFMLGNGKKVTDTTLDRSMPVPCMPSVFFSFFCFPVTFYPTPSPTISLMYQHDVLVCQLLHVSIYWHWQRRHLCKLASVTSLQKLQLHALGHLCLKYDSESQLYIVFKTGSFQLATF